MQIYNSKQFHLRIFVRFHFLILCHGMLPLKKCTDKVGFVIRPLTQGAARLSTSSGQGRKISSFFSHSFHMFSHFPKSFLIFFLNLVLRHPPGKALAAPLIRILHKTHSRCCGGLYVYAGGCINIYFHSRWRPREFPWNPPKKTTFPPEFCNEICTIYECTIKNHNSAK